MPLSMDELLLSCIYIIDLHTISKLIYLYIVGIPTLARQFYANIYILLCLFKPSNCECVACKFKAFCPKQLIHDKVEMLRLEVKILLEKRHEYLKL